MARTHHTLALVALLSGAPLVTTAATAAQTQSAQSTTDTVQRPASGTATDVVHMNRANGVDPAAPTAPTSPQTDLATPATPVPMTLPDNATQTEIKGQYAIGIVSLVIGTVLIAAIVVGGLYFITRRTWSHSH